MLKPIGPTCNLNCQYCYYLSKKHLYPDQQTRMSEKVLREFTKQYIRSQAGPDVTFSWQGGEPMLLPLSFYQKAVAFQKKFKKAGMEIKNTFQTNGTLITEEWAQFLHEEEFLIGISLDGPPGFHNPYRPKKNGKKSFDHVLRGLNLLKKYKVDYNVLTCVHPNNVDHPLKVYNYFTQKLGVEFIQFIPIVVRENETGYQEGNTATELSVDPLKYGKFLHTIFQEWIRRDVAKVFVQIFDVTLAAWMQQPPGLCIFAPTCGASVVMEFNGDLYSCDHFVEPKHKLGNIMKTPMIKLVSSPKQETFAKAKYTELPPTCRTCEVGTICYGGCPKNRFITTPTGEAGLNYLCEGYKYFFTETAPYMKRMANLLYQKRPAADIMKELAGEKTINGKSAPKEKE